MTVARSGALVFYGATGDLAFKKIFPALQRMTKAGALEVPVIGVARGGWSLERLQARARESVEQHGGGADPVAFPKLMRLLRYVEGEYAAPATFDVLRRELGEPNVGHPLELLASHDHDGSETDPYAELLGDAMRGETFRFARQDYVEEAWRIVDPVLQGGPPPTVYEPGSWGPPEAQALVPGGWSEPGERSGGSAP